MGGWGRVGPGAARHLLLKGLLPVCSLQVMASLTSFFFTHWMPRLGKLGGSTAGQTATPPQETTATPPWEELPAPHPRCSNPVSQYSIRYSGG